MRISRSRKGVNDTYTNPSVLCPAVLTRSSYMSVQLGFSLQTKSWTCSIFWGAEPS